MDHSYQDDASEMDWLRAEVRGVLQDLEQLEQEGVESDDAESRIMEIIEVLREWLGFARRGEYRHPEDVLQAADALSAAARSSLALLPRRRGVLQVPLVLALSHLQDFRERIISCIHLPEHDVNT